MGWPAAYCRIISALAGPTHSPQPSLIPCCGGSNTPPPPPPPPVSCSQGPAGEDQRRADGHRAGDVRRRHPPLAPLVILLRKAENFMPTSTPLPLLTCPTPRLGGRRGAGCAPAAPSILVCRAAFHLAHTHWHGCQHAAQLQAHRLSRLRHMLCLHGGLRQAGIQQSACLPSCSGPQPLVQLAAALQLGELVGAAAAGQA